MTGNLFDLFARGFVIVFACAVAAIALIPQLVKYALPRRRPKTVAFFHPYAEGGGGGERVLWEAIKSVQENCPDAKCVVWCGGHATAGELRHKASLMFGIHLPREIELIPLTKRHLLEPRRYPRFTLIGQAVGSALLAWEALRKLNPVVFMDTSGHAFTYPLACWAGAHVVCYTHYPFVSTDMLRRVRKREASYNNDTRVSGSALATQAKVAYYRLLARAYGWAGRYAEVAMVNSSWTKGHIVQLWRIPNKTWCVYPPCDVAALEAVPLSRPPTNAPYIISLAQFRPEKAHALQLEAWSLVRSDPSANPRWRLKMVGSCRDGEDAARLARLQALAKELRLEDSVDWCVGVPFSELRGLLGGATAGLHTMRDEHFGIGIVEYMAAGVIPIAHASGGPLEDIVVPEDGQVTGFLATTPREFADAILRVMRMAPTEIEAIALSARTRSKRFSAKCFQTLFIQACQPVLQNAGIPVKSTWPNVVPGTPR
eukprot:jgi/Mesvir1/14159/Mv09628-RA.1